MLRAPPLRHTAACYSQNYGFPSGASAWQRLKPRAITRKMTAVSKFLYTYHVAFFPISQEYYSNFYYIYRKIYYKKHIINCMDKNEVKNLREVVGKNLKAARLAMGMTQQQVATALGKYQTDYFKYESGMIELDYEKIVFLCKLFDITPDDLFEGLFSNKEK